MPAPTRRSATTTVETAADGTFVGPPRPGPSRHVEAVFAGNRTLTRAGGGAVRLGVLRRRADARVLASGSGSAARRSSSAAASPTSARRSPPEAGRSNSSSAFPAAPWTEFRTVQTDAHGRFRYPYAFSDDDSRGVRFQFRAFAPAADGWPYEPAASRPVVVTGR